MIITYSLKQMCFEKNYGLSVKVLSYKKRLELYEQMEKIDAVMEYINKQIPLSLRF